MNEKCQKKRQGYNDITKAAYTATSPDYLMEHLKLGMPKGSRGEVTVFWKSGGGYSMAWERIGDEAYIFDCQTGTKYNAEKYLKELLPYIDDSYFSRLDNVDLDMNYVKRWAQNA